MDADIETEYHRTERAGYRHVNVWVILARKPCEHCPDAFLRPFKFLSGADGAGIQKWGPQK